MSGRPTKLTPEIQAKIVEALRAGNYIETAAAYAGINKTTLYDWLKRGARDKSGPYHTFSNAVEKAMADAEMRDVLLIANAAKENWQAAAWRLERKYPDKWGRKDRISAQVEHSGEITTRDEAGEKQGELISELRDRVDAIRQALGIQPITRGITDSEGDSPTTTH